MYGLRPTGQIIQKYLIKRPLPQLGVGARGYNPER